MRLPEPEYRLSTIGRMQLFNILKTVLINALWMTTKRT